MAVSGLSNPWIWLRHFAERPGFAGSALQASCKVARPTTIELSDKPLVFLIYQTAWVDESGELNFRKDIYDFDEITLKELEEQDPAERIVSGSPGL
jgi:murein L,D-transpeptidase YcbB/YkuD